MKILKMTCALACVGVFPAHHMLAGQVAVINPGAGSGVAIVSTPRPTPTVTSTPSTSTVSTTNTAPPPTVPEVTVSAPPTVEVLPVNTSTTPDAVTSGVAEVSSIASASVSNAPAATAPKTIVQQVLGSIGVSVAPTTSGSSAAGAAASGETSTGSASSGDGGTSAPPTSVSGFTPQIAGSMQAINVTTFTPQQVSTLISTIDVQLAQPGLAPAARQVLVTERARLAGIAQQ